MVYNNEIESHFQDIFKEAVDFLNSEQSSGHWQVECNKSYQSSTLQGWKRVEIDILVTNNDRPVAVVEVKRSERNLSYALRTVNLIGCVIKCPLYLVVYPGGYCKVKVGDSHPYSRRYHDQLTFLNVSGILRKAAKELPDKPHDKIEEDWRSEMEKIRNKIANYGNLKSNKQSLLKFIERIKGEAPVSKNGMIYMTQEDETAFFNALLEDYFGDKVCRFTSLNSLFTTLDTLRHSMCSIACMNDKSETYYSDSYVKDKIGSGQTIISDVDGNKCFIVSCCEENRADDFTMMRLYGDDAKGVVITYTIDRGLLNKFFLKKVSYQRDDDSHPELDIIAYFLNIKIGGMRFNFRNINPWLHFFKPKEYSFEEEVRLLHFTDLSQQSSFYETKWILNQCYNIIAPILLFNIEKTANRFPLIIDKINLGPKMRRQELNSQQLDYLCNQDYHHNQISRAGKAIDIGCSQIDHYQ